MIGMSFAELAALIDGKLLNRTRADDKFQGVSIDSRTLRSGELFFAIRGPRHDGHDFIEQAIAHRAGGIVAEMNRQQPAAASEKVAVVSVRDSHVALLKLAESVRRISRARFVAITGSNGKTTTKELAYTLISAVEPSTFRSPGNLNNLFGAPLALFALPENTAVAVMELGISTPGEMTRLAGLVQPDIILITNVGPSHLEFLNSVEDVARAKLELARAAHTAPLIINADDPILVAEAAKIRPHCVTFAVDNVADFRPEAVVTSTAGASEVSLQG
ncbi:MAG TPA: UDP-N-acetylmuramoyl-tripeptide--D-alanyl-D-alanine ligase, partial [Candidatus Deferrimicrobium sp.]|nr:UDP-N-acetylmuramoyl-tripeptide--D-alanyl-D-alanine ligase [Candidatus Deferrimicrobium sp.]